MTSRLLLAAVLLAIACAVAWILERRRRSAPPTQGRGLVPHQVDRADFPRPDAPWLVVLWSSRTCESCRGLAEKMTPLTSDDVAVVEVEYQADPELHRRYAIEAAPVTIIVDADGVTRASFAGAFTATDLWAAVANLRD
ncbi:MAG: thioredoxin family protein [Acidimicrobiia bacterium]